MVLKKELRSHYIVSLVWLVSISFLRLTVYFNLIELKNLFFFWLGGLTGTFLLDIDHLIYTLVIHPEEPTSQRVKQLFDRHQFKEMLILLGETHEERWKLAFHNALFQPVFYVFCFWVLSSTASWFGKAMVMVIALHLLKDEIELLLKRREDYLRRWLFWQVKREVSLEEQRVFVILMLLVFVGFSLFLV